MIETCPLCRKPLQPHPMGEKNGYALIACKSCGAVMANPWVTPEIREKFFVEIEPEITHVRNPEGEIAGLAKLIKKICPDPAGKRFLDVGCRNGYAVMAAKQLGFGARGIDTHDFFLRFAQSTYDSSLFEQASVHDYAARGQQADIVFVRECFCEQTDPEQFTADLARLLAPGGVLYIEEPDGNGFNTPRNFPGWPVVWPPMNFLYPSKNGLTALLGRHGLEVRKSFFTWRPALRLVAGKK